MNVSYLAERLPLKGEPPITIPVGKEDGWRGYVRLTVNQDDDRGMAWVVGSGRTNFCLFRWEGAKIIWPNEKGDHDENNIWRLAFISNLIPNPLNGWNDDPLEVAP